MKHIFISLLCLSLFGIGCQTKAPSGDALNQIATRYVRLGLTIGQYDPAFVDAYYGPDSLQPTGGKSAEFPTDSLLGAVDSLLTELKPFTDGTNTSDTLRVRAEWMTKQLRAFGRRIRIATGEYASFDEESEDLFGVKAPVYSEAHFKSLIARLDSLLPGKGSVQERVQVLSNQYKIPQNKIDTVFRAAIEEARRRTTANFKMPPSESFRLEYVRDKPWSGYNWYQGQYNSLIQINIDMPIYIERAIDLACHEGYPGHHVYNLLLEKNLYRDKGWVEISLYPLFSPQSLIAEGSANYGIDVAFPGDERVKFAKEILIPLAGLDATKADQYFTMLALRSELNYARNEAARGLVNGTMTEQEALRWLTDYCLFSPEVAANSIRFIRNYRSYVICYNYGQDLVKNYIEANGGVASAPDRRWSLFGELLSNPITPADLK
ncbi:DUF885 domain-containing protein [Telluribacter sp. SYSU D00476]|uniref:DUF885 domain-containing protein n=1 Tax=Telluribacter sp. SYSU D00476 TaxID=2811430 RepID=UPI001FF36E58|nr:DUF885 domain-containing protein [Telluribacter sp. SYSU D00476]